MRCVVSHNYVKYTKQINSEFSLKRSKIHCSKLYLTRFGVKNDSPTARHYLCFDPYPSRVNLMAVKKCSNMRNEFRVAVASAF
jgi:hypothetical protein